MGRGPAHLCRSRRNVNRVPDSVGASPTQQGCVGPGNSRRRGLSSAVGVLSVCLGLTAYLIPEEVGLGVGGIFQSSSRRANL